MEFDINNVYATLAERIAAARSAVRATSFGRGGVITVVEDGDRIKFGIPLLGKVYDDITKAIRDAAGLTVNETFVFEGGKSAVRTGNKMNAAASVFESVYDQLQNLTPDQKDILKKANIDIKDLKSLNFSISTMRSEKGGTSAVVDKIEQLRKAGTMGGISIIDDEGARVIQFKAGKSILDEYQTNLILSITGHSQLNPAIFGDLLRDGNVKKLANKLAKVGKRQRGILADRDLSLVGDELTKFLTVGKGSTDLSKATLILDPQYEILKIFASSETDIQKVKGLTNAQKAYYQDINPRSHIGNIIDAARDSMGDTTIDELKGAINSFQKGKSGWASDDLEAHLMNVFANKNKAREKLVKDLFSSIEYGDDGSSFLNANYIKEYTKKINKEIDDLSATIASTATSLSDKEAALLRRVELENLKSNISDVSNLQQITGRGNIPGLGNIKTAFEVKDFDRPGLRNFAAVVSKFSLKEETGISGNLPQLILSGLGQGSGDVYVDPVSAAFHPEIFADNESIDTILRHGKTVLSDFEAAIESDTLPDRVLNQLKMASGQNIDQLPQSLRQSALRNRQFAQSLLELHRSGASVKNSPQMMNMLHSFFATQAYREKDGFRQAVLPNTYRFAIDTERSGVSFADRQILNESGFEKLKGMKVGQEVFNIDQDILQFRVTGHKMLLSPQAIGEFRHALGGFDLDDKGLPRLRTYIDNEGKNRLGFYIFRQPSGPEEVIFARAKFDAETVKSLFDNTTFNKTLDKMLEDPNHKGIMIDLKRVLKNELIYGYDESNLEEAIASVYQRMEEDGITTLGRITEKEARNIAKYGSSSLRVDPRKLGNFTLEEYLPDFNSDRIYRVLGKPDAFDMSNELLEVVRKAPISKSLRDKLLRPGISFQEMMQVLGNANFKNNSEAQAILATTFNYAAEQRAKQAGGILGQYVNRSMFAGSVLNQYEDMFNSINDTTIRNFLAKNYNIGLLSQEEAIDSSINFSGSRQLHSELMQRFASSYGAVDEKKMASAIAELTKIKRGNITLDVIGEEVMSNLGKLIGFSRGLDVGDKLRIGIDEYLMDSRLKGGDIERLAQGVLSGMVDAKNLGLGGTDLDEQMSALSKVLKKKNEQDIKDYLLKTVAIGPDSEYASLSKLQRAGLLIEKYFDSTRSQALNSMGRDEILMSSSTSPEARAIAKKILDDNKKQFNALAEMSREQLRDMSNEQKAVRAMLMDDLGRRVFGQMRMATQAAGVSMEDLVNAIDLANAGTYRDISSLGLAASGAEEMFETINQVRRLRKVKYYERFNQEAAQAIRGVLQDVDPSAPVTLDSLGARARKAMEAFASLDDITGTVEEGIYRTLMNETSSIDDSIIRQESSEQVNIIRAMIEADELQDVRASLEAKGTITAADLGEDADQELVDLINATTSTEDSAAARPAVYKRITEKASELKNLFKEDKLIRRGTLAIAALAIGSLAYSEIRDRTVDDVTGPPLLPGGNPYEQEYPSRGSQIADFRGGGYNSGMSYQVSIQGGREDIDRFNSAAGGLVNGNVSTTIHNNIPNMRRDPYSEMGLAYRG